MKYAIIAAGEGSRLAAEGITVPKPLVEVNGEHLIDRLIRIFMQNDAEEIVVICNDMTTLVASHLVQLQRDGLKGRPVPLRFVVKSTPSSMHSFFEISKFLSEGPFVMTTVDTIFREDEFADFVASFRQSGVQTFPVTDFIDDEKPLYVGTDEAMNITGFFDENNNYRYISAGIYGLLPAALDTLRGCMERGESRMRNFQRALITDGLKIKAFPLSKVLDIDHAGDILKAEQFLQS
ncbi:MAG: NTP transferase domain-containing protein [Prevotella sp.]|nr:NTP transferase domain-containing protein [Prevotella sp.]